MADDVTFNVRSCAAVYSVRSHTKDLLAVATLPGHSPYLALFLCHLHHC